jgi:hypothetical protein
MTTQNPKIRKADRSMRIIKYLQLDRGRTWHGFWQRFWHGFGTGTERMSNPYPRLTAAGAAQMIDRPSSVPFCESCEARGKLVVATVVDHKFAAWLDALDRVRFTRE